MLLPLVLLCVSAILASIAVGLKQWRLKQWRERRHMRLLQDDLNAAEREGRERDQRAKALQRALGRSRLRG